MLDERFVLVGIAIGSIGTISYLINTIKGKTKPNKVSWFFWSLAPLIAFYAQITEGVGIQAWLTFSVGFGPLLIFLASFLNRKSEWKITKFDIGCGIFAAIGIILWQITGDGVLAIIFGLLADGVAAIPTVAKSYSYPETEDGNAFLFGAINGLLTLLTIKLWNVETAAFPAYILFICIVIYTLVKFRLGPKLQKQLAKTV